MEVINEVFNPLPLKRVRSPNLGGAREGAGRKTRLHETEVSHIIREEGGVDYAVARAKKEEWLAKTVEFDYRIKQGEYVSRESVRAVCATAFAAIAQTLRSLPDALERREGVSPDLAERIGIYIDDAMETLSQDFQNLVGEE